MTDIPILNLFAEIKSLGHERLQELCNQFVQTPIAREFAISELFIAESDGKLTLIPSFSLTHSLQDREAIYLPTDQLLYFIVDNGITDEQLRLNLKHRIQGARQTVGPDVYRRFAANRGEKLPLFLTCKNPACGNLMQTQLTAYRCETSEWNLEPILCPRCHQIYRCDGSDLHFGPNE